MKIFSCYTPSHEILFEDYFSKTLPASFENHPYILDIAGRGDFKSAGFLNAISEKIRLIVESLESNAGSTIIWSDVDIVFCDNIVLRLDQVLSEKPDVDVFFQKEFAGNQADVNTGFIVMRCHEGVRDFFGRLLANEQLGTRKNEQEIVNEMLGQETGISWDFLPRAFYARSQGWPPPDDIVLYHANVTAGANGVQQKIKQFKRLESLCKPTSLHRFARKISRRLGIGHRS